MLQSFIQLFSKPEQVKDYRHETYVEYTKRDPNSKELQQKSIKHDYQLLPDHEDWKRTKFESIAVAQVLEQLKGSHFKDLGFPHTNSSISQEPSDVVFQWRRVTDLVKFIIYSSTETYQSFERISFANKKLKEALLFVYRTNPDRFKQLLAKQMNNQGLYEFKLYYKGVIHNVVIDDYVPVLNGIPLMIGPVAEREVFLMLIQKAVAKVCNNYENIPENADELAEILYGSALRKNKVVELTEIDTVYKIVEQALSTNGNIALISKNQAKLRSLGISQNQIYHIINRFSVRDQDFKTIRLYEMISEKKLSSWNGKYSHNDQNWDRILSEQRTVLFKNLAKNKSFFMSADDISYIFDHLIAVNGINIMNKQWLELESENDCPSFSSFQIRQKDDVFVRITSRDQNRTSLIIAQDLGNNQYKFIDGIFHQNAYFVDLSLKLKPGRYVICVHHDWVLSEKGFYSIFLTSNTHCILKIVKKELQNFLPNIFTNLSINARQHQQAPSFLTLKKCYSIGMLAKETGFAFIYFSIQNTNQKQLYVDIDLKGLDLDNWQILQPNKSRKSLHLDENKQQEIIILKTLKYLDLQSVHFPSTAFKVKI